MHSMTQLPQSLAGVDEWEVGLGVGTLLRMIFSASLSLYPFLASEDTGRVQGKRAWFLTHIHLTPIHVSHMTWNPLVIGDPLFPCAVFAAVQWGLEKSRGLLVMVSGEGSSMWRRDLFTESLSFSFCQIRMTLLLTLWGHWLDEESDNVALYLLQGQTIGFIMSLPSPTL